ncbi:carboxypeptidase regulatory-like domain-containing protein [Thalassiella azotivora]
MSGHVPVQPQPDDDTLLDTLRRSWQESDPVPEHLAVRSVFAVRLLDLDAEVARLVEDELAGAGSRAEECARTITFSSENLTATITVSESSTGGSRIDGWLAPAAALRVELRRPDEEATEVRADEDGRFVLDGVPSGLVQLVFHPVEDGEQGRVVAAPPVRL